MRLVFATFVVAVMAFATPSQAQVYRFDVTLDSSLSGTGSAATGSAIAFFDVGANQMVIEGTFDNLEAAASNAHLHGFSNPGSNSGVLIGLSFDSATSGSFSGSGSISGDDANFSMTLGGMTYINIHSTSFPGGEIRGHLTGPTPVPEPASIGFCLAGGLALLSRRRR